MNKKALITGATAGIGEAVAHILAQNSIDLIICGRRSERLETLKTTLEEKYKVAVITLSFDIRELTQVEQAFNNLPPEWKNISILINNAGLAAGLEKIQDGNIENWERMIDTNVKGLLYISRLVIPIMVQNKCGHIVNIGSIAGKEVYPNGNVYCGSKHAVDAISKAMRIDLLAHNIKVTQICPGMVETEFSLVRFEGDAEAAKNVYKGLEPLYAKDIAEAVWFALNRPQSVNINEIIITPTAQASATQIVRNV